MRRFDDRFPGLPVEPSTEVVDDRVRDAGRRGGDRDIARPAMAEHQRDAGIGEVVLELTRREQRVQRNDHGAGQQRAVEQHREGRDVRHDKPDPVARCDAARPE
jgi:hypothetical protein